MRIVTKTYNELMSFPTFEERFNYAKVIGFVGKETFGPYRYLNQRLYSSDRWKEVRRKVILRDDACDLGFDARPIGGNIYVHHLNPITIDDILEERFCVFDLNNLVCTSFETHNAIHYGGGDIPSYGVIERRPNDTCPWK